MESFRKTGMRVQQVGHRHEAANLNRDAVRATSILLLRAARLHSHDPPTPAVT